LVKDGIVDVLVVHYVFGGIVFLFDIFEILLKLLPGWIFLSESEVFPEFFVEQMVYGRVAINSRAGVAILVPDTTSCSPTLIDFEFQALLAKP
jgi:hypothetical protein